MINVRFLFAIGIVALFGITGCWQQSNNALGDVVKIKTLEVNHLKIVDTTGKSRGVFRAMPDGTIALILNDDKGLPKCGLSLTPVGDSALEIADNTSKVRVALGLKDGLAAIELYDKNNKQRLAVGLRQDGEPVLNLSDDQGKVRASLSLLASNTPCFGLFDNNNELKAGIWINPDNQPEYTYYNKEAIETAKQKACFANLRILQGAIEMYEMDYPDLIKTFDKKTMEKLQGKYLKTEIKCPDGGVYVSDGNLLKDGFLKCTTHGAIPNN